MDFPSPRAAAALVGRSIRRLVERLPSVVLIDGTWRRAGEMLRTVGGIGRRARLPDAGDEASRYWLHDQAERYLGYSPLLTDAPDALTRLHVVKNQR